MTSATISRRLLSRHALRRSSYGPRPFPRTTSVRLHASKPNHNPPDKNSLSITIPTSFAIGSCAGLLGSLAGMGGGFVMIPLMTSRVLKLTQHQAHGTSLFAVAATGLAGAYSYGNNVQLEEALAIAVVGMLSARVGAKMTTYLSEKALRKALGVLMLAMAPAVPAKAYIMEHYSQKEKKETDTKIQGPAKRLLPPATIGLFSGFLAGVFGVGGGVIVVPALAVATNMNHYQALATSLAAMTLPAAVGTYTHFTAGNVAMRVAPGLALGALAGAYVGGKVALHTDEWTLRWGFSGLLAVLGIRTLVKA